MTTTPATTGTPPAVKTLDLTFLEEGAPKGNLEKLSHLKFSAAPASGCLTRAVYGKVPYFKPSPESIQKFSLWLGLSGTIARLSYGLFGNGFWCMVERAHKLDRDFFAVTGECLVATCRNLLESSSQFTNVCVFFISAFTGVGCYIAARAFFKDYSESARFQMLDKEFSAIAEVFIKARKENNPQALQEMRMVAARLKANLPKIEDHLKTCARLDPVSDKLLIAKLKLGISQVLPEGSS